MPVGWNFPSNNYGQLTGIGEAGIETFKGAPYCSLAREICQNSLDARADDSQPVIVEFKKFYIKPENVPGIDELRQVFKRCKEFWQDLGNKKTVDFFNKALHVIGNEKIPVLRISDFNTTGLIGSDKEYNSPWQNLVKAAGVSDKDGAAGGSFGIGKSAPYACSELRTIFYSTFDQNKLLAAQGVARLVSFKDGQNQITQGTGYYGETQRNTALTIELGLDKDFIRRGKNGTDVYVLGFFDDDDWEQEMIKSILDGFLISIFSNKLIVKIEDNAIAKKTLPFFINNFRDAAKYAYNYYQVLTSEASERIIDDFAGLGRVELYVLMGADLHRKVLIARSNGMKIFDKQNISSTIHFAGILILKDTNINAYFRQMETPQHNAWEPERLGEPAEIKKARKNRTELFRFIKNTILAVGRNNVTDEIDAEGVGEYLPDEQPVDNLSNPVEKGETITDKTRAIELKVVNRTAIPRGFEKIDNLPADEEADAWGDYADDETGLESHRPTGEPNQSHGGEGTRTAALENENGKHKITREVEVNASNIRLFITDESQNKYQLTLVPEKSAFRGYIQIKLAGEQSSLTAPVKKACLNDDSTKSLKCSQGKIYIDHILQKQKLKLSFILDYVEDCSLEVSLYGYSL